MKYMPFLTVFALAAGSLTISGCFGASSRPIVAVPVNGASVNTLWCDDCLAITDNRLIAHWGDRFFILRGAFPLKPGSGVWLEARNDSLKAIWSTKLDLPKSQLEIPLSLVTDGANLTVISWHEGKQNEDSLYLVARRYDTQTGTLQETKVLERGLLTSADKNTAGLNTRYVIWKLEDRPVAFVFRMFANTRNYSLDVSCTITDAALKNITQKTIVGQPDKLDRDINGRVIVDYDARNSVYIWKVVNNDSVIITRYDTSGTVSSLTVSQLTKLNKRLKISEVRSALSQTSPIVTIGMMSDQANQTLHFAFARLDFQAKTVTYLPPVEIEDFELQRLTGKNEPHLFSLNHDLQLFHNDSLILLTAEEDLAVPFPGFHYSNNYSRNSYRATRNLLVMGFDTGGALHWQSPIVRSSIPKAGNGQTSVIFPTRNDAVRYYYRDDEGFRFHEVSLTSGKMTVPADSSLLLKIPTRFLVSPETMFVMNPETIVVFGQEYGSFSMTGTLPSDYFMLRITLPPSKALPMK